MIEGELPRLVHKLFKAEYSKNAVFPYWPISLDSLDDLVNTLHIVNVDIFQTYKPWEIIDNIQRHLRETITTQDIHPNAHIEHDVVIQGPVKIERGARIMSGVIINGPVYIGENAFIGTRTLVRNSVILGGDISPDPSQPASAVGSYIDVAGSIVGKNVRIFSKISRCLVGSNVWIAGGVNISNMRLDTGHIMAFDGITAVDTQMSSLGAMIGDGTNIATGCILYPGVLIGQNCTLFPGTIVSASLPNDVTVKPVQTVNIIEGRRGGFFRRKIDSYRS